MNKSTLSSVLAPLAVFMLAAFLFMGAGSANAQLAATVQTPACYQFNVNLQIGSTGDQVVALQNRLIADGFSLPSIQAGFAQKGYFGVETQNAVKKYQTAKGIEATGYVGPLTRATLNVCGGTISTGATLTISTNSATPPDSLVIASQGENENELTTPLLVFDVKAGREQVTIQDLVFNIARKGPGNAVVSTVYLYDGPIEIDNASFDGNSAVFRNVDYTVAANTLKTFTVRVDIRNAQFAASSFAASLDASNVTSVGSSGNSINEIGSAQGNHIEVRTSGPEISVLSSTIVQNELPFQGVGSQSTTSVTATFNLRIRAVGGNVIFNLPGSTENPFKFGIYVNGTSYVSDLFHSSVDFAVPSSEVVVDSTRRTFTVQEGSQIILPVSFRFLSTRTNRPAGIYSIGLDAVQWKSASGEAGILWNGSNWRTSGVALDGSGNTQPSITVISPNGGETVRVGRQLPITWKSQDIKGNIRLQMWVSDETYAHFVSINSVVIPNTGAYNMAIPSDTLDNTYATSYGVAFKAKKVKIIICDVQFCDRTRDENDTSINLAPSLVYNFVLGDNVNLAQDADMRSAPSYTQSILLGTNQMNSRGVVVDGPIVDGTVTWIKVDFEKGYDGWVESRLLDKYVSTQPSITVVSPNGGEKLIEGQEYPIKWNASGLPSDAKIFIHMYRSDGTNRGDSIVSGLPSTQREYKWKFTTAGNWAFGAAQPQSLFVKALGVREVQAADGYAYKIFVSAGWNSGEVFDYGDSYFSINPTTITNKPPVIAGLSSPTLLQVGQTGTWSVKASDPENGSLSYSVDWGDNVAVTPTFGAASAIVQTSTFTHSYATAGKYNVRITVTDNKGLTAQTSATVTVQGATTQPSITILSPNESIWSKGSRQQISWSSNLPSSEELYIDLVLYNDPGYYDLTSKYDRWRNTGSWTWESVGTIPEHNNTIVPDGKYWVRVCNIAQNICDKKMVTITSSPTAPITVTTPSEGSVFDNGSSQNVGAGWQAYTGDFEHYYVSVGNMVANVEKRLSGAVSRYSNGFNTTAGTIKSTIEKLSGRVAPETGYYFRVEAIKTDAAGDRVVARGKSAIFSITSGTPVVVCPVGYICTPYQQPAVCPAGYTCTPATASCPTGYNCYSVTPTTPVTPVTTSAQSITPLKSTVNSGSTVRLTFTIPAGVVSARFYMNCPTGTSVKSSAAGAISYCNRYTEILNAGTVGTYNEDFYVTNTTSATIKVTPSLQVFKSSSPGFPISALPGEININPVLGGQGGSIWDAIRAYWGGY